MFTNGPGFGVVLCERFELKIRRLLLIFLSGCLVVSGISVLGFGVGGSAETADTQGPADAVNDPGNSGGLSSRPVAVPRQAVGVPTPLGGVVAPPRSDGSPTDFAGKTDAKSRADADSEQKRRESSGLQKRSSSLNVEGGVPVGVSPPVEEPRDKAKKTKRAGEPEVVSGQPTARTKPVVRKPTFTKPVAGDSNLPKSGFSKAKSHLLMAVLIFG